MKKSEEFDVIVVGAGPAGLMAAITAADNDAKVALLDKNRRVGKKLLMTGGGRCNVTNTASVEEIIQNIPGNGTFLHSAFSQFNNQDIAQFFRENGVELKEEDHGRLFPATNHSKTIVDCLFNQLLAKHVSYYPEVAVKKLLSDDSKITGLVTENQTFKANAIVLATGGKTYPSTGSTGDGYQLAQSLGHTITPLYATESALLSPDKFITEKRLQGLSLRDVKLSVLASDDKVIISHTHDLLFTHFGLSGPAALRASSFVNQELLKGKKSVRLSLDVFPEQKETELFSKIQKDCQSKKATKNALALLTAERLLLFALENAGINSEQPANQVSKEKLSELAHFFKNFLINVKTTMPIEKSFVTAGGISLKEVNPKTLQSKLIDGLYFAGELLDINGYTGGYNITAAFVTGHTAGTHAAWRD